MPILDCTLRYYCPDTIYMETAFFWIAWGIASIWALKSFYFSYSKRKLERLYTTAFAIELAVLMLFFVPWLPVSLGNLSGWELILQGDIFMVLLGFLIIGSALAFVTKDNALLKLGAISHVTASILFILIMIRLMPGSYPLTLRSTPPILASLLLLVGNAVILLLWQQLDLKQKKRK